MASKQEQFKHEQRAQTERLIEAKAERARAIEEEKRLRDAELRRWH